MARAHPASASTHRAPVAAASSPALLHAAWVTAVVAVCLAFCTIHSRKPSSSSSRKRGSRSPCGSRESNGCAGGGGTAGPMPAAKVSPTPSDKVKANNGGVQPQAARGADGASGGPVTVIDVGTHGPIAPAFLPAPDPLPPRRSLSVKHIRLAERIGSYRPRQPRSVPVTRSNSFAGVGSHGARRPGNPRF